MEFKSCYLKQDELKKLFVSLASNEKKYEKIIELGQNLPPYPSTYLTDQYLVQGCQSRLYLHVQLKKGVLHFQVYSDALISAGLAALLVKIYEKEPPEAVLQCPPHMLKDIGLFHLLTPSRSNGLRSLYVKMQQEVLDLLNDR